MACVSQDAQGKETTVNIDINGEKFIAHGITVIQKNYLEVYIYEKWSDKQIANYEAIKEFQPTSINLVQGETEPPQLLTEADLISLMDKHGIGTDATHADHIETVKQREYIGVQGNDKLVPGFLGIALCEGYDSMGFQMSKPNLRAELEADLKSICEGNKNPAVVLQEQIGKYRLVFELATAQVEKIEAACTKYLTGHWNSDLNLKGKKVTEDWWNFVISILGTGVCWDFQSVSKICPNQKFELVCLKNALGGILCPKCFFHPQKLNLFWFCLGLKSVLETFSFKMKIAMWLFFPFYVFLCMYHAEYKHLRWYQLCHDYVIEKIWFI